MNVLEGVKDVHPNGLGGGNLDVFDLERVLRKYELTQRVVVRFKKRGMQGAVTVPHVTVWFTEENGTVFMDIVHLGDDDA